MPITKAKTDVINLDKNTIINSVIFGKGAGTGINVAIGDSASSNQPLRSNTTGFSNLAMQGDALAFNTTGNNNTALGPQALYYNTTGTNNVAIGNSPLHNNTTGGSNIAIGPIALYYNTTGLENVAIGGRALNANIGGLYNTAIGDNALGQQNSIDANLNTAVGWLASYNQNGNNNTVVGAQAFQNNNAGPIGTGNNNVAVGNFALRDAETGGGNTAVGKSALQTNTTGINNTAVGNNALLAGTAYNNTSALGYNADVTGSNQIQLGDSATTTYAYGAVQNRSDTRDKTDVRDTELGLDFVKALRPVDFKWDIREDYRANPPETVFSPSPLKENASDEEKEKYEQQLAAYNVYKVEMDKWIQDSKLSNINHNGSKKRNRFHHGLIAQEVKAVLDAKGIDFGGYQDHKIAGGDDVLSVGYSELIAPMIKAIQELSAEVASLKAQLNT